MGKVKVPDQETVVEAAKKGIILDWSDSVSYGDRGKVIPIDRAKEKRNDQRT